MNATALNILNSNLLLNKSLIKYQIQELLKAECGLSQFRNHLTSQNEVLNNVFFNSYNSYVINKDSR